MQRHSVVYGFAPGRIDVFWCARDESSLMHTWSEGPEWRTETIAKGNHPFAPAASAYVDQPGKMDVGWIERWGKIKYRQFNGGRWLDPMDLDPSSMSAASGSAAPASFYLGSPLVGCPNAANRRSGNTEFFVSDVASHLWNLSFDGTTWTVADCDIDRRRFDCTQLRTKIYTATPVPTVFWCDGAMRASYVSAEDPSAVNTMAVPGAHPVELQPMVIEWLGPDRVDIFWADGRDLNDTAWDGSRWSTTDVLRNFGTWRQTGSNVHIELNGHIRDGIVNGDAITGTGVVQGRPFTWSATKLSAGPDNVAGSLRDTKWQCTDGDDRIVLEFEFLYSYAPPGSDTNLFRLLAYDKDRPLPEDWHYSSEGPVAPAYGLRAGTADLFWRSAKGELIDTYFDGKTWRSDPIATDLPFTALPAAIYNPLQKKIHVFWLDADGSLWNASSDGNSWAMKRLPVDPLLQPTVLYGYTPGRMDIFWGGTDKSLKQTTGDGTSWNSSPLNLGPVSYQAPTQGEGWDSFTPAPIVISPQQMASAPASGNNDGQMFIYWGDKNGQLFYYQFDGNWHITALPQSVSTAPPPSNFLPDNWNRPQDESFWMKSPPAFCRLAGNDLIYWIDGVNRLCETTRWNRPSNYVLPYYNYQPLSTTNPWSGDWKTTIVDFNPGNYSSLPNFDPRTGMPNLAFTTPPQRRDTNFPSPSFSSRFAPVPLNGPTPDSIQLLVCDLNLNLWQVALTLNTDQMTPPYSAQNLSLGPLGYAPVATVVPPVNNQGGGTFIFWCSAEDRSLKQSRLNANGTWDTLTIDPGPVASAPAQLLTPSGELHLFWAGANGLKHKSVMGNAIASGSANGSQDTETLEGLNGFAPFPVYNAAQQKMYVFWLDGDGALMQTILNAPGSTPRWQTANIVPVVASITYHEAAGGH